MNNENQPFRIDLRVFDILDNEIAHVHDLRQLFGRGSNGDLCVRVKNNVEPAVYDALRARAAELQLVDVKKRLPLFPRANESR